jgi:hypothetical protein
MASGDGNFPVPRISRERNSRPAMTKGLNDIWNNLENFRRLSRREEKANHHDAKAQRIFASSLGVLATNKSWLNGDVVEQRGV